MPKYPAHVSSYTTTRRLEGSSKDGGTKRREVSRTISAKSLGGKLESFYYALGEDDLFAIFPFPRQCQRHKRISNRQRQWCRKGKDAVLLTPEEVDQAAKKSVDYSPPEQDTWSVLN